MSDTKKAETINDMLITLTICTKSMLGTELSDTYETYEYAQIGDISDFYEFRNSIDDTDADTKRTSIVNYLYNSDLEDNQIANLWQLLFFWQNIKCNAWINTNEIIKLIRDIQGQYNSKTGQTIVVEEKMQQLNTLILELIKSTKSYLS